MDTIIVNESLDGLFIVGLVVSVIIAYGVQFLLSSLSLATGVSMIPNIKKKSVEMRVDSLTKDDATFDEDDDDDDGISSTTITSAVGAWVLITSSLALFAGSYFGISLLPVSPYVAMVAGLVIWALFFITLLYIEYKAVHTIVGGLIHSALSGLRYSASALGNLVTPSEASKSQKQVKQTVRALYQEVDHLMRKNNVDKRLEDYIHRLTPDVPTKNELFRELEKFVNKLEVQERINITDEQLERVLDVQVNKKSRLNKENATALKDSFQKAKTASGDKPKRADKVLAVIDSISPVSDEEAKEYRTRVADILDRTSKDELNSEEFKQHLEQAFDDPRGASEEVLARLKHFDRATIKEIVHELSDMDNAQSDRLVDLAYDTMQQFMGNTATRYRESFQSAQDLPAAVEGRIATYFDGLGEPSLQYDGIRRDVQHILEEPTSAPQVVRDRLAQMDKGAAISLLSSNSRISEEQAESIADNILMAKDNAVNTIDGVQKEVNRRYQMARRKAVIASEHYAKMQLLLHGG